MVKVVLQCQRSVKEGGAKEAEHGESWFLSSVEDEVARIDREGRAVIDKCLDVDIFLAKCVNIYYNLVLFSGVI